MCDAVPALPHLILKTPAHPSGQESGTVHVRLTGFLGLLALASLASPVAHAADSSAMPLLSHSLHLDIDAGRWRERLAASMRPSLYRTGVAVALTEQLDFATGLHNPGNGLSPEQLQLVAGFVWRF
jgi:hypothetical protein